MSLTDATSGPINYCFKPYVPSKTALEDFADTRWSWHKPNPRPLLVRFTRNADEEGVSKVIGLVHPKALPLSDVERLAAVSGEGVAPAELIFQIGWRLHEINKHHHRRTKKNTAADGKDFGNCIARVSDVLAKAALQLRYGTTVPSDDEIGHRGGLILAYRAVDTARRLAENKQSSVNYHKADLTRHLAAVEEASVQLGESLVQLTNLKREYDKLRKANDQVIDLLIDKK